MAAGHGHGLLHRPGSSVVHRLPPQVKIVSVLLAILAVVATPAHLFFAFGLYLLVLFAVWVVVAIPPGWYLRRAVIELPFVVLAVVLPVVGTGPRTQLLGVSVSIDGTLAGWNILAKGTIGVLCSLTLAATTTPTELLWGLRRLHAPKLLVTITTLMIRYLDVIVAEARRMRVARISRGHDPRFLWQVGATARGVGSLFIRAYERGERVHLAMLSRGWQGWLPDTGGSVGATWSHWLTGLAPAAMVALIFGVAVWTA
jgi:cobalt/nickel transport system permease protein